MGLDSKDPGHTPGRQPFTVFDGASGKVRLYCCGWTSPPVDHVDTAMATWAEEHRGEEQPTLFEALR